jgi:hypothetical protein
MPYIDPTVIEQAKQIDLLSYLKEREPDELVRIGGGTYTTKTHNSLKISNGRWYWWSQGIGGKSALDYLIKVREMTFLDAVAQIGAHRSAPVSRPAERKNAEQTKRNLLLPKPATDNTAAFAYLGSRGIDARIIERCQKDGLVYASKKGNATNVVFIGRDKDGHLRYAALRGVSGNFKGEAAGSDKRFAFKLLADVPKNFVHVFEGAIDALSYATLVLQGGMDYRTMNLLSLGGIPQMDNRPDTHPNKYAGLPKALAQFLVDNPETKHVYLHLDNDEPGIHAADTIAASLRLRGLGATIASPPKGKDVNDYLLRRLQHHPPKATVRHISNPQSASHRAKVLKTNQPKER